LRCYILISNIYTWALNFVFQNLYLAKFLIQVVEFLIQVANFLIQIMN
jgi:hypothetical protein